MNILVKHSLNYSYSSDVSLDPHIIYLFPRLTENLTLKNYSLNISPEPSNIYQNIDLEGNIQTVAFFNKKTTSLLVDAKMELETSAFNPFDFVFFPFEANQLFFPYTANELSFLNPFLEKSDVTTLIENIARDIAIEVNWSTSNFLMRLCNYINSNFAYQIREEGVPQTPEYTFINRLGSCRDYSVFFISCCRSVGLASRFVSGYFNSQSLDQTYLHAWAEVYLPGGGWRGFDPTQNTAVSDMHIPVASSLFPEKIGPVTGAYRGDANSFLITDVIVSNFD